MEGSPFVQGIMVGDVFDPRAIRDEPLLSHCIFKFIPLLGDVDLLATRELELGPAWGLKHMFLDLQLGVDGLG